MKFRMTLAVMAVSLAIMFSGCNTKADETTIPGNGNGNQDEYKVRTVGDFVLQWKTDTLGLLHVKVSAPTTGWVAVGFNPSMGMQDANVIIGYVKNDTVFVRDDYGSSPSSHSTDVSGNGESNLSNLEGSEANGETEIRFTIPLNSGDARDCSLMIGMTYTVILACGEDGADGFDMYHRTRTSTSIEI